MGRGEMPIEPGDSWFSPKCMEVQPLRFLACPGGKALDGCGAVCGYQAQPNPECPGEEQQRVRRRGLTSVRQEGNNPDRRLRALRGC